MCAWSVPTPRLAPGAGSDLLDPGQNPSAARIFELLRLSDKVAARVASAPAGQQTESVPSSAVAAAVLVPQQQQRSVPPIMCSTFPTWSDAGIQAYVQQSLTQGVQSLVQPRLDGLAERMASVVASTQCEIKDVARLLQHLESRLESRLTGLEQRAAALHEAGTRTEQRERDLNHRIAGIAAGIVRGVDASAQLEAELQPRLCEVERRMHEVDANSHRLVQQTRVLEEQFRDFEGRSRAAARVGDELRELLETRLSARRGGPADSNESIRMATLEQRVAALAAAASSSTSVVQAPPAPERSCQVTLLEGRIEGHRAEFDALAAQLMSRSQELQDRMSDQARRHEEMRTESRTTSERTRIVAARIEEIEHGIGALRVKSDGFEGRLAKIADRVETNCKPLESHLKAQLDEQRRMLTQEVESRVEVMEHRVMALQQMCEDVIDETLGSGQCSNSGTAGRSWAEQRAGHLQHLRQQRQRQQQRGRPLSTGRSRTSAASPCASSRGFAR